MDFMHILRQKEATLNTIFSIFERWRGPPNVAGPGKTSPSPLSTGLNLNPNFNPNPNPNPRIRALGEMGRHRIFSLKKNESGGDKLDKNDKIFVIFIALQSLQIALTFSHSLGGG